MFWARVDNRLVHGQIIETWLPFTGAKMLVVANDELAGDVLQQEIMSLAIPSSVSPRFVRVDSAAEVVGHAWERGEALVLFATCGDARRAFNAGLALEIINIGNVHYGPGKKQICSNVALSVEDEQCLRFFEDKGVQIDFRCLPSESVQVKPTW